MALGVVIPVARQRAFDSNGAPLAGAKLESWLAGTSTPQALYSDDALSVPLPNPVIADGNGYFPAMFSEPVALKLELRTSADVVIWTTDDITSTNLFTGLIATAVRFGHYIGEPSPPTNFDGLNISSHVIVEPPYDSSAMIRTAPQIDATLQTAILKLAGFLSEIDILLGSAGAPLVYGMEIVGPSIGTLGAVPIQAHTLKISGLPTIGATRFGIDIEDAGLSVGGPLRKDATITPTQLTANVNDYNPTGIDAAYMVRLSSDASRNITGLLVTGAGGPSATQNLNGRELWLTNVGAQNVVLVHESASSVATNRFILPGAANYTLTPGLSCLVIYDNTDGRWRVLGNA